MGQPPRVLTSSLISRSCGLQSRSISGSRACVAQANESRVGGIRETLNRSPEGCWISLLKEAKSQLRFPGDPGVNAWARDSELRGLDSEGSTLLLLFRRRFLSQ